jgi:hypothetical protein
MADTLTTIHQKIASLVDQSTDAPTFGSSEWNVRTTYINRAIEEWGNAYDWSALYKNTWLTGASGATYPLPSNFRKMATFPKNFNGTYNGEDWPEIQPQDKSLTKPDDHFFYVLGDRGNGFNMIWNPGTLSSGASIRLEYFAFPTSLVSASDRTECSDPEFLIDRTISYILESRSDARFQEMETKARERLLQMVDNENDKSGAYNNTVITTEKRMGFRFGRD